MNEVRKSYGRAIAWWLVNLALFAVSLVASFQVVARVHHWAWPLIFGQTVTIMEAIGYSMGGGIVFVDAYRLHRAVPSSACSESFAAVLSLQVTPCRMR